MWTSAIRNIFVAFAPAEKSITTPALDVAISMADQAAAHLTVRALSVQHVVPYSIMPQFAGSLAAKINEDERQSLQRVSSHLDDLLKSAGFPNDVSAVQHPHTELVELAGRLGRMHDISVIDSPADYVTLQQAIYEELVFQTGRPVLIVPPGISTFAAKRIVVAWDGSPRAARALSDAMPFLVDAEHVELTTVVNDKELARAVQGADMARRLAHHNVKVEVVQLEMIDDAGSALMDRAGLIGADMIVSGAFAHSRWRHLILGGVTTSLLRETAIPVFMSH